MPIGATGDSKVLSLFGSVSDIFGKADAETLFSGSASANTGAEALRASIKALDRELNRLLGFKTDFSPGEQKRLETLQTQIGRINEKASSSGKFTAYDLEQRGKLYQEAYRIMGKDYVELEGNAKLQALTDKVDALLEPRLQGAQKVRLERLRKLEDNYLEALVRNPENETASRRLRSVKKQISSLTPPRDISQLSPSERRDYDALVDRINDLAGQEYLLPSKKRIRAEQLQTSKAQLEAQAASQGTGQSQASAGDVARAYTRLA